MERNSETKTLSFSKGMTNIPSDLLSGDDELQESVGFIYKDGEMKPIQKEKTLFEGESKLPIIFVHKYNGYKHYIALNTDNTITWYDKDGTIASTNITGTPILGDNIQVQALGNTLVVNSSDGLGYYLWKPSDGNYKYLGAKIPEPELKLKFIGDKELFVQTDAVNLEGIVDKDADKCYIGDGKQSAYNDAALGAYSGNKKKICEKSGFCNPFFARFAVELYDGSFTNISIPVLMIPAIGHNSYWITGTRSDDNYYLLTYYSFLRYTLNTDYSEWIDLVKSVTLFLSKGVDNYNTATDQEIGEAFVISKNLTVIRCGVIKEDGEITDNGDNTVTELTYTTPVTGTGVNGEEQHENTLHEALKLSDKTIDNLKKDSIFYKVKELPLSETKTWINISFDDNTLENLTSKQQMDADYYSNCTWGGKSVYVYNQRLHVVQPFRKNWEGAGQIFSCSYPIGLVAYTFIFDIYVFIKSNNGEQIIHKEIEGYEMLFRTYFFYPDPKAYKAVMIVDSSKGQNILLFNSGEGRYKCKEIILKESLYLNGAYWFGTLPDANTKFGGIEWSVISELPLEKNNAVSYDNQILTSEVGNPWVFTSKGNNTIGSGEVLGIASQTTALSQGQFGQYPLIAFCSDGIWALQTDNEGLYATVHPMSREICNNSSSITETDGYIFFTTKKGLMIVNGSQVKCVSERMNGKTSEFEADASLNLKDYLDDCFIAYDYRDSLLWITKKEMTEAFVYNMKDGTFGIKEIPPLERVINDYPDTLLQGEDGKVYSLLEKPDINDDTNTYDGTIITRPLKLGGSLTLKSLRKIKHLVNSLQGNLKLEIWASNNTKAWCQLHSLGGKPWSYFVFKYKLSDFKANDAFTGTIVRIQNRREIRF